jgi:hypothetical protein
MQSFNNGTVRSVNVTKNEFGPFQSRKNFRSFIVTNFPCSKYSSDELYTPFELLREFARMEETR